MNSERAIAIGFGVPPMPRFSFADLHKLSNPQGMFGFIASPCAQCTEESFPAWRGSFCGLARCLGREYGNPSRMLVNRDATFLALLGVSLDPSPPRWQHATCCNPLVKPFPVADDHPAVLHAAAVSVCGLSSKLDDDAKDEGPIRRIASRLGTTFTAPATDRAVAWLNSSSFPTQRVLNLLAGQDQCETDSPERADQPTAKAFGQITGHLARVLPIARHQGTLETLGSALGSLVYWRDAWDDQHADLRKHRFNPFHQLDHSHIRNQISTAWLKFTRSLSELPVARNQALFQSLQQTTEQRHARFLALETKDKKKRRRKSNGGCWRHCDCCPDCCCDCGPGDSGCCDCCPCDG